MITNERQYAITKAQLRRLQSVLALSHPSASGMDPQLHRAMMAGLESQIADLDAELRHYEYLPHAQLLQLQSLSGIGRLLTEGRIARRLTQYDLAHELGLKPQQIQRYEATEYRSASLSRLAKVAAALRLDLKSNVPLAASTQCRDLQSLLSGDTITFEETQHFHTDHMWHSVLIKLSDLYDSREFLRVVEKHLRYGTKLYYVLPDESVLDPLREELARRHEHLDRRIHDCVRVILADPTWPESGDEFVVFNFLEGTDVRGFIWESQEQMGKIVSPEQLLMLAKRYLRPAHNAEDRAKKESCTAKPDRPVVERAA